MESRRSVRSCSPILTPFSLQNSLAILLLAHSAEAKRTQAHLPLSPGLPEVPDIRITNGGVGFRGARPPAFVAETLEGYGSGSPAGSEAQFFGTLPLGFATPFSPQSSAVSVGGSPATAVAMAMGDLPHVMPQMFSEWAVNHIGNGRASLGCPPGFTLVQGNTVSVGPKLTGTSMWGGDGGATGTFGPGGSGGGPGLIDESGPVCVSASFAAGDISCPYGAFRAATPAGDGGPRCLYVDSVPPERTCPFGFDYFMRGCIRRTQLNPFLSCPSGYQKKDDFCIAVSTMAPNLVCPDSYSLSYESLASIAFNATPGGPEGEGEGGGGEGVPVCRREILSRPDYRCPLPDQKLIPSPLTVSPPPNFEIQPAGPPLALPPLGPDNASQQHQQSLGMGTAQRLVGFQRDTGGVTISANGDGSIGVGPKTVGFEVTARPPLCAGTERVPRVPVCPDPNQVILTSDDIRKIRESSQPFIHTLTNTAIKSATNTVINTATDTATSTPFGSASGSVSGTGFDGGFSPFLTEDTSLDSYTEGACAYVQRSVGVLHCPERTHTLVWNASLAATADLYKGARCEPRKAGAINTLLQRFKLDLNPLPSDPQENPSIPVPIGGPSTPSPTFDNGARTRGSNGSRAAWPGSTAFRESERTTGGEALPGLTDWSLASLTAEQKAIDAVNRASGGSSGGAAGMEARRRSLNRRGILAKRNLSVSQTETSMSQIGTSTGGSQIRSPSVIFGAGDCNQMPVDRFTWHPASAVAATVAAAGGRRAPGGGFVLPLRSAAAVVTEIQRLSELLDAGFALDEKENYEQRRTPVCHILRLAPQTLACPAGFQEICVRSGKGDDGKGGDGENESDDEEGDIEGDGSDDMRGGQALWKDECGSVVCEKRLPLVEAEAVCDAATQGLLQVRRLPTLNIEAEANIEAETNIESNDEPNSEEDVYLCAREDTAVEPRSVCPFNVGSVNPETGLCETVAMEAGTLSCPEGYTHTTQDIGFANSVKSFKKSVQPLIENLGVCELLEYADYQIVCPVGYKREKAKNTMLACTAEKYVKPSTICPPGFFLSEQPLPAILIPANADSNANDATQPGPALLLPQEGGLPPEVAAFGAGVPLIGAGIGPGSRERECVKLVQVAPSVVTDDDSLTACSLTRDQKLSCGMERKYHGATDLQSQKLFGLSFFNKVTANN